MEWQARLPLIWAIVRKDLSRSLWAWIAAIVISAVLGFLLAPVAIAGARFPPPPGVPRFVWFDFTLRGFYAVFTVLTSLTLGLAFYTVHSEEIRKGTIRSIILYPVDMNDVTIAKLLSSFLLTLAFSTILFFGPLSSFFALGLFPLGDFLAVYFTTLAMAFLALATGVFLSHILARYTRRMVFSPAALGSLFMLLAILLTETAASTIGTQLLYLNAQSRGGPTIEEIRAVEAVARAISVLSPHHMGARILANAFGIAAMWPDLHVVVPVAALILAGGYLVGKKLYLDVFIR